MTRLDDEEEHARAQRMAARMVAAGFQDYEITAFSQAQLWQPADVAARAWLAMDARLTVHERRRKAAAPEPAEEQTTARAASGSGTSTTGRRRDPPMFNRSRLK